MASKVKIYSTVEPGVCIERHQIDANECVQRGGWSFVPVDVKPTKPVYNEPSAEGVEIEPVPLPVIPSEAPEEKPAQTKGKPGRKPKSV